MKITKYGPREKFVFPPNKDGAAQYDYSNPFFQYIGEWKNGKKNGRGRFNIGKNGYYEGEFLNGEITGVGIRVFANGSKYEGQFSYGEFNGKGKYTNTLTNEIYEGEWKENQRHGMGVLIHSDGTKYSGNFVNHKKQGLGTYTNSQGDIYEGEWTSDKIEGKGTMKYSNGDVYEGEFVNGMRHGNGTIKWFQSGYVVSTIWNMDKSNYNPTILQLSDLPPFTPGSMITNTFVRIVGGDGESGRVLKIMIEIGAGDVSSSNKKTPKIKKSEVIEKEPKYLPLPQEGGEAYLLITAENGVAMIPSIAVSPEAEQTSYTIYVEDESQSDPLQSISAEFQFVPASMASSQSEKMSGKGKPPIKKPTNSRTTNRGKK